MSGVLDFSGEADRAKTVDLAAGYLVDTVRVLPLGDSNTLGTTDQIDDSSFWAGYRDDLWAAVTDAGLWMDYAGDRANGAADAQDIDHRGVSGIRAARVAEFADGIAHAQRPDVVLLMLGSTDAHRVAHAEYGEPEDAVPEALLSIMQDMARIVPEVTILLAPLPPVDPEAEGFSHREDADLVRDTINALLPGVVETALAEGIDARLVAMDDLGKPDLYDGSHLTPEGQAKMAQAWFGALAEGLSLAGGDFGDTRTAISDIRDVNGSQLGDLLRGDAADNRLDGQAGNDRLEGGDGHDRLRGGEGIDVLLGGRGHDQLRGGDGMDTLFAGRGHDDLFGNAGQDELKGRKGKDNLRGGEGADTLIGGEGSDSLRGGADADIFQFAEGDGTGDQIRDFEDGLDMIRIISGAASFDDLDIVAGDQHALVSFSDVQFTVKNTDISALTAEDFLFG